MQLASVLAVLLALPAFHKKLTLSSFELRQMAVWAMNSFGAKPL